MLLISPNSLTNVAHARHRPVTNWACNSCEQQRDTHVFFAIGEDRFLSVITPSTLANIFGYLVLIDAFPTFDREARQASGKRLRCRLRILMGL